MPKFYFTPRAVGRASFVTGACQLLPRVPQSFNSRTDPSKKPPSPSLFSGPPPPYVTSLFYFILFFCLLKIKNKKILNFFCITKPVSFILPEDEMKKRKFFSITNGILSLHFTTCKFINLFDYIITFILH